MSLSYANAWGNVSPAPSDVGQGDYGAMEDDALAAKSFSNVVNGLIMRRTPTSLTYISPKEAPGPVTVARAIRRAAQMLDT